MRLKVAGLRGVVKRDLPIEFTNEQLTSYGGLEVLRRYFQRIGLHARLRNALADSGMGSDYGASRLALLLVTLFVIGARRLEHLAYVATDPLIRRICGLGTLLAGNTRNSGRSTGRSARARRRTTVLDAGDDHLHAPHRPFGEFDTPTRNPPGTPSVRRMDSPARKAEKLGTPEGSDEERATGLEPATSSLGSYQNPCRSKVLGGSRTQHRFRTRPTDAVGHGDMGLILV